MSQKVPQKMDRSRREILKKAAKGAILLPYIIPAIETILVQPLLMQDLYGKDDDKGKHGGGDDEHGGGEGGDDGDDGHGGGPGPGGGGHGGGPSTRPAPPWLTKKKKCSPGFIWAPWKKECVPVKKIGP